MLVAGNGGVLSRIEREVKSKNGGTSTMRPGHTFSSESVDNSFVSPRNV